MIYINSKNDEYCGVPPVETPKRIDIIKSEFSHINTVELDAPSALNLLYKVHSKPYVESVIRLAKMNIASQDTSFNPSLIDVALNSINTTKSACLNEDFAIVRPAGHHAGKMSYGGFCYFNNIVAGLIDYLDSNKKVAVIDLDAHYGNGTHQILSKYPNSFFASIHADCLKYYPAKKIQTDNSILIDVEPENETDLTYLSHVKKVIEAVWDFKPEIIGISMGFDTYVEDEVLNFNVKSAQTYFEIGRMLADIPIKQFAVLEGGYHSRLGKLCKEFYSGWKYERN
jgi:acetoin utilization deacetylase AcuC-like enzyme